MPQMMLPIFPEGCTHIVPELTFAKKDGQVTYFHGLLPVFTHDEKDIRSFRMIRRSEPQHAGRECHLRWAVATGSLLLSCT